jgi:UDPglucose 6-dehydrogenase
MKIVVVGIGYVGLANAILLSTKHYDVELVDIIEEKVDMVNAGRSPIDCIADILLANNNYHIHATTDWKTAYSDADYILIATPTDYNEEADCLDTSSVENVIQPVKQVNPAATIVIKSTVPIGYTKSVQDKYHMNILYSPEFLREAYVLADVLFPSRVIIGTDTKNPVMVGKANEWSNILDQNPVLIMSYDEAESVKLFSNAYLALRVSFFNELDTFATMNGLDTNAVIYGVCMDNRIGNYYNCPSFGYGGYCLPKDTKQLSKQLEGTNGDKNIITAISESNAARKDFIVQQILDMHPKVVGIYCDVISHGWKNSVEYDIEQKLINNGIKTIVCTGSQTENELKNFKRMSDVILCNRVSGELEDVKYKVYTRDLQ